MRSRIGQPPVRAPLTPLAPRARLAACLATLALAACSPAVDPDVSLELGRGQFALTQAGELAEAEAAAAAWSETTLPRQWSRGDGDEPAGGWYRGVLELVTPPDRLWAVYLPHVSMNAEVFLNGERLGDGGRMQGHIARNWNRPLYFTIPNGLLAPGENQLHVHVRSDGVRPGLLGPIHLGSDELLRGAYEGRHFSRITLSRTAVVLLAAVAGFVAVLWWRRRAPHYAYFALSTVGFAFGSTDLFWRDVPLPAGVWTALSAASLTLALVAMLCFLDRLVGRRGTLAERLGWAAVPLVALVAPAPLAGMADWAPRFVAAVHALLALRVVWSLAHALVALPLFERALVGASAVGVLALLVHDRLAEAGLALVASDPLAPYGAPLLLAGVGWGLVNRFADALEETEGLNRHLEYRVRAKHAELEESYRRTRRIERERALADERERIMRDMHDGMGGHLVSALSMVESREPVDRALSDLLRDALDDMRLVIDSMDSMDDDLASVLAMLRMRLEPRLRDQGILFRWQVTDLPPLEDFGPARVLQVMRVLQEAITNSLKHAGAQTITVETGRTSDGTRLYVAVRDDGCGIDASRPHGRGLTNMARRTELIGGDLDVRSSAAGTSVTLFLPASGAGTAGGAARPAR